jgi:hypothetical protein
MSEPDFEKVCGKCGKVHDRKSFLRLADPPRGNFQADEDGDQIGLLLKNCDCGTTLAVRILKNRELAA